MQPVEIGEAEIEPESCSSPTMALMVASEEIVEVDDDAKKKVRETGRMCSRSVTRNDPPGWNFRRGVVREQALAMLLDAQAGEPAVRERCIDNCTASESSLSSTVQPRVRDGCAPLSCNRTRKLPAPTVPGIGS